LRVSHKKGKKGRMDVLFKVGRFFGELKKQGSPASEKGQSPGREQKYCHPISHERFFHRVWGDEDGGGLGRNKIGLKNRHNMTKDSKSREIKKPLFCHGREKNTTRQQTLGRIEGFSNRKKRTQLGVQKPKKGHTDKE